MEPARRTDGGTTDARTRAKRLYTSDIGKDPHEQAPHENSRIELHVRS